MLGSYLGAALLVGGFSWLLLRLGLVERAGRINPIVRSSAATLADKTLSDDEKERALQGYSLALFGLFGALTLRLALALGLPMLLVWLVAFTRVWSFDGAITASLSWPFLTAGLVLFLVVTIFAGRRNAG